MNKHKYKCVHCGRVKEFTDRDIMEMESGRYCDLRWKCKSCKDVSYSNQGFVKIKDDKQLELNLTSL